MKLIIALVAGGLVLACPVASLAQVYRCTIAGKPVYQQQPCAESGGVGKEVDVRSNSGGLSVLPPSGPVPSTSAASPAPAVTAPTAPAPGPGPAPKSGLDALADVCLDWYRPRLRDPRGAYRNSPVLEKGVLTMTIYATNGFGGYVQQNAACEFKGQRLDENWTKIHADRLGW